MRLLVSLAMLLLAIVSNIVASSTVNTPRTLNRSYAHLSPMAYSDMGWAATRFLGLAGSAVGPSVEICFSVGTVCAFIVVACALDRREFLSSAILLLSISLYVRAVLCMSNYSGPLVSAATAVSQYADLPEWSRFPHGPALSILLSTFSLFALALLSTGTSAGYIILSFLVACIPVVAAVASRSQRTCDAVASVLIGGAAVWLLSLGGKGAMCVAATTTLFFWLLFLPIALYITPSQQASPSDTDRDIRKH